MTFNEDLRCNSSNLLYLLLFQLLWSLVLKNGWDQTKLPDIEEGFSYVSINDELFLLNKNEVFTVQKESFSQKKKKKYSNFT